MRTDPEKLRQATTNLAEAHKQNKLRETEQRSLNMVFTPMVGSFTYWPDHLLEALSDGTLNPNFFLRYIGRSQAE